MIKMGQMVEYLPATIGGFEAVRHNHQTKTDANLMIILNMWAWRIETTACQEATDASLESKEPTSLEMESDSER
jgi:hypothetical protein